MFINPDLAVAVAREHQRDLLAEAGQRRERRQCRRPAPVTTGLVGRTKRRLVAAFARPSLVAPRT